MDNNKTNIKKLDFDSIRELIHHLDAESGAFVFKDPSTKFSIKEKILSSAAKVHTFLTIFFIVSTLYIKNCEPISVVMVFSYFNSMIGFPIQTLIIHKNKDVVKHLFEWCEGLYDIEKKFESVFLQEIARSKMIKVQKYSEMIIKWFKTNAYVDSFGVVIIPVFIGVFLRKVPNFKAPLPFYLPIEHQENLVCFILTIIIQLMFTILSAAVGIFLYDYFFCVVLHIIGYLDIIQEVVETVFKKQMIEKTKEFDEEKPVASKGTLKIETLMEINDSIEVNNKNEIKFDEWMKILCDMITDVNNQITSLKLLYTGFFLSSEVQTLASLFTCGFVFTVIKEHYILAVTIATFSVIFFFFCFINELILQRLENIENGFYDIPWYYLSINEKKMLLIALNCSRIQDGFTAAGIHKLTLDRFSSVVIVGYKNFVVLKDLVTK